MIYEQGTYNALDFKGIGTAFSDRSYYETKKNDNTAKDDLDTVLKGIISRINN